MKNGKNWALLTAIAIPVLFILTVILSIYWPHQSILPKINFAYMLVSVNKTNQAYPMLSEINKSYYIREGKLINNNYYIHTLSLEGVKFYIYDVINNKNNEISFSDAQKLVLNPDVKSPDGFEIMHGYVDIGGFYSFFSPLSDYNTFYIKKNNTAIKLNIQPRIRFLGWIKNQGVNSHD